MKLPDLISEIGNKTYTEAVEQLAAVTETVPGQEPASPEFIHDLDATMAELGFSDVEIWAVWNELIFTLPCYATWMYTFLHYQNSLERPEQLTFLAKVASILDNSLPPISTAAEYALWVDFFEYQDTVSFAWSEIEKNIKTETGQLRLLSISGPVPFPLKLRFYENFLENPQFHRPLLSAFYACLHDVYGQADKAEIGRLLRKLEIDEKDEILRAVMVKLP